VLSCRLLHSHDDLPDGATATGNITGPDDLPGKRVATTAGSTSAAYLRQQHSGSRVPQDQRSLLGLLAERQADAVVLTRQFSYTSLMRVKARVVGSLFHKEIYGIVLL